MLPQVSLRPAPFMVGCGRALGELPINMFSLQRLYNSRFLSGSQSLFNPSSPLAAGEGVSKARPCRFAVGPFFG